MSFNQSTYGIMEDDGTVNTMIVLSQTSSVQFEVMISATDITAGGMYVASYHYLYYIMFICVL